MKKIEKIYLDLDGVMADFDGGVKSLAGMVPCPQGSRSAEEEKNMWEQLQQVEHFYNRLEYMPGAQRLFFYLREMYGDRVEILSGIPRPNKRLKTAKEDKRNWVKRKLSPDVKVNLVYRSEKTKFCTGEGTILIDDYSRNIDEWIAAGGTGILHTDCKNTQNALQLINGMGN